MIELTMKHGQIIEAALELYAAEHGRYPSEAEGLKALLLPLPTTKRPPVQFYLGPSHTAWLNDGWGEPISYSLNNGNPSLRSAGPDMHFGNEDDLQLSTPSPAAKKK